MNILDYFDDRIIALENCPYFIDWRRLSKFAQTAQDTAAPPSGQQFSVDQDTKKLIDKFVRDLSGYNEKPERGFGYVYESSAKAFVEAYGYLAKRLNPHVIDPLEYRPLLTSDLIVEPGLSDYFNRNGLLVYALIHGFKDDSGLYDSIDAAGNRRTLEFVGRPWFHYNFHPDWSPFWYPVTRWKTYEEAAKHNYQKYLEGDYRKHLRERERGRARAHMGKVQKEVKETATDVWDLLKTKYNWKTGLIGLAGGGVLGSLFGGETASGKKYNYIVPGFILGGLLGAYGPSLLEFLGVDVEPYLGSLGMPSQASPHKSIPPKPAPPAGTP